MEKLQHRTHQDITERKQKQKEVWEGIPTPELRDKMVGIWRKRGCGKEGGQEEGNMVNQMDTATNSQSKRRKEKLEARKEVALEGVNRGRKDHGYGWGMT